ncbi:hypothetical protein [Streptacidiphilus neutrinimicus]|uniref:hypothetical protein n=1 Tax=Streptacidiphilus neutrinimicus TaxID=105420 RepID=UPI0005AA028B|nr:hypothetical protein [Streptacidiphilus neutrinimicus]
MDATAYNNGLADLRPLRDEIAKLERDAAKLNKEIEKRHRDRDGRIVKLGSFEPAKASVIAKAAGLSIGDIVTLVPRLDPTPEHARAQLQAENTASDTRPAKAPTERREEPEGAVAPTLPAHGTPQPEPTAAVEPVTAEAAEEPALGSAEVTPPLSVPGAKEPGERIELPVIPDGPEAARYTAATKGLFSKRPPFQQKARETAFLDATTGVMVGRGVAHLDLGTRTPGEILDAVMAVSTHIERIYITAGAPWHADTDRYPTMKQAVTAWLHTPSERWIEDTSWDKERLAGHFVPGNARLPVGRYTRAGADRNAEHVEIRAVNEWFDPAGADPHLVREAFALLWKTLRQFWPDAVLLGSPSQTGKDLWARTIPIKGQWADGFPVLSEELRGLFHATAGQGRTELIVPPKVPAELPGLAEYDRTFAYARHTWKGPVGTPRHVTAAAFAKMSEAEQKKLLMSCAHLRVRVTVPDGWEHVGLLPAPISGDRHWEYPSTPGATFTTWAGAPEVYTALSNPIKPWRIEVLDALVFQDGEPIDKWSLHLKEAWNQLSAVARVHEDPRQRQANYLAARAVRSILLFGIGGFAQRPRMVTGTTAMNELHLVPEGAEILTHDEHKVTWQRVSGFRKDDTAHPEWSAYVWSSARAALLSMNMKGDGVHVGALHVPAGEVVAFRTDAVYLTARHGWPYHGQPGEYLLKGHLTGPISAPGSEDELLALRDQGRAALAAAGGER